ncbi:hypothetical protein [Azotobacter vinelandii]
MSSQCETAVAKAIGALKIAREPAAASVLYGFAPGATLATVAGVPIEGAVMRWLVNASRAWYARGR